MSACRPSFWSTDITPLLSLSLPASSPFCTSPPPSACPPPIASCIRDLVRTAPRSSHVQVVAVASSSFCYSLFEACGDLSHSPSTAPSAVNAAATSTSHVQFSLIYVDRDHLSDEVFQNKLKEISKAREHVQRKRQELQQFEAAGGPAEKKRAIEMEIKSTGESLTASEKRFMEMHAQREQYRAALKQRGSGAQPFFDHTNALFASFKPFPLHCFNTQTAVSPTFSVLPPQISFRFIACTHDDTPSTSSSKIPQLSVVIESTDLSVTAFNDPVALLTYSKVILMLWCVFSRVICHASRQAAAAFLDFRPFHLLLKRFEGSRAPLFLRHKFAHRSTLQNFQSLQHFPRVCRSFLACSIPHSLQATRHKPLLTPRSSLSCKQSRCSGIFKHNPSFCTGTQSSRGASQGCVRN